MVNDSVGPKEWETISFLVTKDVFDKLKARMPGWGERTEFFRQLIDDFLDGKIEVVKQRKF